MNSTLKLIAIIAELVALLCGSADGVTTVRVRTTVTDCNAQRCLPPQIFDGTGFLIGQLNDGRLAFLTAAHVTKNQRQVAVQWYDGMKHGEVIAADIAQDFDVALIAVSASLGSEECGNLVDGPDDAEVELTGLDPVAEAFMKCRGRMRYRDSRVYGADTSSGCSGGAWKNGNNIYGVHWGRLNGAAYFTTSAKIRLWLRSRLGYIPSCGQPPRPPVVATPGPQPPQSSKPIVVDVPGCDCKNYDGDIAALRAEIHAMKAPIKVQIQRDGVVIDEDTYDVFRGQPIVLNFRKKTPPASGGAVLGGVSQGGAQ